MFTVDPIGYFQTSVLSLYDAPRQPSLSVKNEGIIHLNKKCQFEQALEGLEGFDYIWVIFRFHKHSNWKPKVLPPRGGKKQGVFATRSPHRPNWIGLSCVRLQAIKGLQLFIVNHDLIDGTPILDIKPYINYADSLISPRQGWLDSLPVENQSIVQWSSQAKKQIEYLARVWDLQLQKAIEHLLANSSLPYGSRRIKKIGEQRFELAYQTWRIRYRKRGEIVLIESLRSGYDEETLNGKKTSKWSDLIIHQDFIRFFAAHS